MKTTLLIMAAGIGSRFGTGIKQLEPVDDAGHIIMDYSIHDAIEAGFNHVVFIIRRDIEKEYGRITIREQKTRWGSCSSKGNLNFNWKLVLMPEEVLDYVVVHELAHRKEMNHSERFWNHVEKVLPDYQARRKLLRELEHRHL